MKILVTGAAGFIGSHVARRLVHEGHQVTAIDNFSTADHALQQLRRAWVDELVPIQTLDITDFAALEGIFAQMQFDAVYHLAAKPGVRESITNPFIYASSNYVGTLNVFEAAHRHTVSHVIAASSSSVYGRTATAPFSEDQIVDEPVSIYASTKRATELLAYTYCNLHQMNITMLRFFTVYGPYGRPDMAPWIFTEKISQGKTIQVFDHGRHKRDFTYIDDIVAGCVALLVQPAGYEIFNLGNNQPIALLDFIAVIETIVGKTAQKEFVDAQPGDVNLTYADISKAKHAFGFAPTTSIETGLQKFISWYKDAYDC